MNTCNICKSEINKKLLTITLPDRFEKAVKIRRSGYKRFWFSCNLCGAAVNVLPLESYKKLSILSSSYYAIDLNGSNLNSRYKKIMSLKPSESDNFLRCQRVIDFINSKIDFSGNFKLMDIGAGTGVFLSMLVKMKKQIKEFNGNLDLIAIEPDPIASNHLIKLNNFKVISEEFSQKLKIKNCNLITLNKVLEHIQNPLKFLLTIKGSLEKFNGFIYIEVPDILTIKYKKTNDNILGPLHFNLYDMKTLLYLLYKVNLMPLKIERIFEPSGKITLVVFASTKFNVNRKY